MTLSINTFSKSLTIDTHYARTPAAFPVNIIGSAVNINIVDSSGANAFSAPVGSTNFWSTASDSTYTHSLVNGSAKINISSTANDVYAHVDSVYNGNNWIKNSTTIAPDLFGPSNTVVYNVSTLSNIYSGGPLMYGELESFTIDNTAYDNSTYWNFYNSNVMTDGDSGEIVLAGNKPQNWGFLYLGIAYQDMNNSNISTSRSTVESTTLAASNYQVFLDFDDYPEYSTDLARRFHSYDYTGYSATNEMGFRYSRTGNSITVESFNPSNGSAIYNRTVTVDAAQDARIFLMAAPSSSLVGGTYDVISQSGSIKFLGDQPAAVTLTSDPGFEFPNLTSMSGNYSGNLGSKSFWTSRNIEQGSASNGQTSINSVMSVFNNQYTKPEYKTNFWISADKGQTSKTQADARSIKFFIVNEADIMFLDKDGVQTFEQVTPFNDPIPPVDSTTGVEGGSGSGSSGPVQTWF